MENKKININAINLNIPKKKNSDGITLKPELAKLFISGMLHKKGISSIKIKETLDILDSKINHVKKDNVKKDNVKKDNVTIESNVDKKDDIEKNNDSKESLHETN